ncbi:uncharacterized protein LOC131614735 [Vicia villosa]|uniref:uncharacterized protein LOC131614735 n=1 Tax=Vicia villosa TaxID=3911 RepID=UPI00273B9866|nr:uncharacterized protein LOC131614735 [Vicia villosa]
MWLVCSTCQPKGGYWTILEYRGLRPYIGWWITWSWIISYFHRIHGYDPDPAYIDAMPRATRYVLQRGNQEIGPGRVYLDRTSHNDIQWTPFTNYGDVVSFNGIALYSGWLDCGAKTMVRYLPGCMRQFGRVQMIRRSTFEVAPDIVTCRDLTTIFEDLTHYLVPEEYRRTRTTQS